MNKILAVFFMLLPLLTLFAQNDLLEEVAARDEFRKGVGFYHKGRYNMAIMAFERSLTFEPESMLTQYWLGKTFYASGYEEAALSRWHDVLLSGRGTAFLENRISIIKSRRTLAVELDQDESWIPFFSIEPSYAEGIFIYQQPTAIHARHDASWVLVSLGTNEALVLGINGIVRQRIKGDLLGLNRPFDICDPGKGFFYLSEFGGDRIMRCSYDGREVDFFGKRGTEDETLLGPQYLTYDEDDYLYISEWGNRRISKWDKNGKYILSFGRKNDFFEGFLGPSGVAIIDQTLYAADKERKLIFAFDLNGNYLKTLAEGQLAAPEGMAVLDEKNLLIADTYRVLKLNLEKESSRVLVKGQQGKNRFLSVDLDLNHNMLLCDFNQNNFDLYTPAKSIYSGFFINIVRINADNFPRIIIDVSVEDVNGNAIVGLDEGNFRVTEGKLGAEGMELRHSGFQDQQCEIVFLLPKALSTAKLPRKVLQVFQSIKEQLGDNDICHFVSAAEAPLYEAGPEIGMQTVVDRIWKSGQFSDNWQFDKGLRFSAGKMIPGRKKRMVVFLYEDSMGPLSYQQYNLGDLARYLRNNHVLFSPLILDDQKSHEELEFLAEQSGSRIYRLEEAGSLDKMISALKEHKVPTYTISYHSRSWHAYGVEYIPCEVETFYGNKSGRDEAGFFPPRIK